MAIAIEPPRFLWREGGNDPFFHIVLVEPEIPPNTGSIARLSAATGAWLHLVEPLGYSLEDRYLKRAGLDYWPNVRLSVHPSLAVLEERLPWERTWLFSKKATHSYVDVAYEPGSVIVFGPESRGLPESWLQAHAERTVTIPQSDHVRSLNLAQAAAIGSYEIVRQHHLL